MDLYIDTSTNEYIYIAVFKDGVLVCEDKVLAKYRQAEKLLASIDSLLKINKLQIKKIKKIKVNNEGEGFSALRIGVVTANALAYGLGVLVESSGGAKIKFNDYSIVRPSYSQEPNIG